MTVDLIFYIRHMRELVYEDDKFLQILFMRIPNGSGIMHFMAIKDYFNGEPSFYLAEG